MQGNALDTVKAFYATMNSEGVDKAFQFLSEDFKQVGGMPEPRDKTTFRRQLGLFFAANPDMKAHLSDIKAEAGVVTLTLQFNGTHSQPLDLSPMGLPVVPASGKAVTLPPQQIEYTVVEGKIKRMRSLSAGHAPGLSDVFKAFGVSMPNE